MQNNWSRAILLHQIEGKLFARTGKAIDNFEMPLPAPHSDLARETLKNPYTFDFLTLREKHDEKELEDALVQPPYVRLVVLLGLPRQFSLSGISSRYKLSRPLNRQQC
jgi:predicted nuclease of restriction endonuclease-like (RecB) superfamily